MRNDLNGLKFGRILPIWMRLRVRLRTKCQGLLVCPHKLLHMHSLQSEERVSVTRSDSDESIRV